MIKGLPQGVPNEVDPPLLPPSPAHQLPDNTMQGTDAWLIGDSREAVWWFLLLVAMVTQLKSPTYGSFVNVLCTENQGRVCCYLYCIAMSALGDILGCIGY